MTLVLAGVRVERDGALLLAIDRLELAAGRCTVVLGPNGAGKTTLLRVASCLEAPAAGSVSWSNASEAPAARDFAVAFQRPVMLRGTVRRNLELGLELRGLDRAAREARLAPLVDALRLEPLLERNARSLSAGEAQRVNVARALSLPARFVLLDEPFAALDQRGREQLLARLPELLRGRSAVVVTHDREQTLALADDVVALDRGRVRAAAELSELFRSPRDAVTASLLGYSVHAGPGGLFAVPPGGWRIDPEGEWSLEPVRTLALDGRQELVARIAGATVRIAADQGIDVDRLRARAARTVRVVA